MKNVFILFLLCCISTTYAQKIHKKWSLDLVKEVESNLKIAKVKFGNSKNINVSISFAGEKEKLLADFMAENITGGVYGGYFFVNGILLTGTLTGYYPDKQKAFKMSFMRGIRIGEGFFYDKQRKETKVSYQIAEHPLYENPDNIQLEKPVLYLYPTEKTEITVKLDFDPQILTHTYPKYNPEKGWNVTADANGELKNTENGKNYYALFWEGESQKKTEIKAGFVIKGNETADFLEEKLAILGLNWRESNEFIMYWLPEMENNNFNLIHFATEEYTSHFPITITPKPDNFIRVFMVFEPLDKAVEIPTQVLNTAKRAGFTAVEWGGTKQEKPKF